MARQRPKMGVQVQALPAGFFFRSDHKMNEHQRAQRWVDLHEDRQRLIGEIAEAKAELERVEDEMEELFWEMGTVGKGRAHELLEAK